jgi:hypothetical protein
MDSPLRSRGTDNVDTWRFSVPSRHERDDPFENDGFDERPSTRLVSLCPSSPPYNLCFPFDMFPSPHDDAAFLRLLTYTHFRQWPDLPRPRTRARHAIISTKHPPQLPSSRNAVIREESFETRHCIGEVLWCRSGARGRGRGRGGRRWRRRRW